MRYLILVRGLPGSGKTTLARLIAPAHNYAADDYFTDADGTYRFDPSRIGDAHGLCQARTHQAMQAGASVVAVHNTFVRRWEMHRYHEMAAELGYRVTEVICTGDFSSVHGVPADTIEAMRRRWEP